MIDTVRSAEERAEKIAKNYMCNGNEPETAYEKGVVRTLIVLISEAIREAEEVGYRRGWKARSEDYP